MKKVWRGVLAVVLPVVICALAAVSGIIAALCWLVWKAHRSGESKP